LTTLLIWPVIAALCLLAGRRVLTRVGVGAAVGFLAVGSWSFVLNLAHTGHVLGHGQGRVEEAVSPSLVTDLHTFARITYRFLDVGLLSDAQIWGLAGAGALAVAIVVFVARRIRDGADPLPLLAPLTVLGLAPAVAWIA